MTRSHARRGNAAGCSAALCQDRTTRSVENGIPTPSVGTSLSAMFRAGKASRPISLLQRSELNAKRSLQ